MQCMDTSNKNTRKIPAVANAIAGFFLRISDKTFPNCPSQLKHRVRGHIHINKFYRHYCDHPDCQKLEHMDELYGTRTFRPHANRPPMFNIKMMVNSMDLEHYGEVRRKREKEQQFHLLNKGENHD